MHKTDEALERIKAVIWQNVKLGEHGLVVDDDALARAIIPVVQQAERADAIDKHIFDWFNNHDPDEMVKCLRAYEDRRGEHTQESQHG